MAFGNGYESECVEYCVQLQCVLTPLLVVVRLHHLFSFPHLVHVYLLYFYYALSRVFRIVLRTARGTVTIH